MTDRTMTDGMAAYARQAGRPVLAGVLMICVVALLSACGFQLRGSADLPAAMEVSYIEGVRPFGTLADDFAAALRLRNITVTDSERLATAVLHIIGNSTQKLVLSVDTSGNVLEYELRQTIRFSVQAADQQVVVAEQSVSLSRDYIFSSTDVLGKQREEQAVRATLQENLVNLAMLRIAAAAR
jgi:LPS-assembly lipoprotein